MVSLRNVPSCWLRRCLGLTASLLLHPQGPANAAGLAVPAQSASAAAVAVAGVAAGVDDAATVFYNAAGMTRLTGDEFVAASGIVRSDLRPSETRGADVFGQAMQGSTSARDTTEPIPSVYAVFAPTPNLRIGGGLSTPYGQSLAYESRWIGRYEVENARLLDNSISLAIAYRVTDAFAVGASLDYHRALVRRDSAVDFGAACAGTLGVGPCAAMGLFPQQIDGKARLDVTGHGRGIKLSGTMDLRDGWRTGLAYRSSVRIHLDGELRFDVPTSAAMLNATGAFDRARAHATLRLPESLHWGLSGDIGHESRLHLGATWERWSRLSALHVDFDSAAQQPIDQALRWRDATSYAVGISRRLAAPVVVHAGLAWHQSPVDPAYASPLFPIGRSRELSLGLTWKPEPKSEIVISYGFQTQATMQYANANRAYGQVSGTLRQHFHALGIQFGRKF